MSYRNQKVMAALEEAELTGGSDELVPAAAAEVEAGAAEIAGNMTDVDDLNATVSDASGEVEALTDVQDLMQESVDSGEGMTEETAAMAEVAVERILDKLGFKLNRSALPGLETFGNKGSRLSATKLALESVSESLKKAGMGIIAFLKQIWEKLKSFFAGLIKSRAALGKNLAALQKRAAELKGQKPKEETLKSGAAKALSVDGKADLASATTVLKDSAALATASQSISTVLINVSKKFDPMKAAGTEEITAGIEKALSALSSVKPEKGAEGKSYFGHLVGGKAVAISKSGGENKDKVEMNVEAVGKTAETAAALTAEATIQLLAEADVALKTLNNFDKVDKELQAVTKSALDHLNKLLNLNSAASSGDKGGEDAHKDVAKVVNEMREVANIASKVGLTFPGLLFNAIKAATDYAAASLNNLKGEDAPAKDGEDSKKAKK